MQGIVGSIRGFRAHTREGHLCCLNDLAGLLGSRICTPQVDASVSNVTPITAQLKRQLGVCELLPVKLLSGDTTKCVGFASCGMRRRYALAKT
jgi:hypothetical protein